MSLPISALRRSRPGLPVLGLVVLAAFAGFGAAIAQEPPHSAELDAAIIRAAKRHGVPEHLVRRIVMRESRYNPRARNHSFWGLMQISYPTARSMGFKGTPEQLLNPVTNLAYAVPYLANAFVAAGRREDAAVRLYASGYYATAKSRGILGVLRTADSAPLNGVPDEPISGPAAVASADSGGWSLFGSSRPTPATEAVVTQAVAPAPQQLAYASAPAGAETVPAQARLAAIAQAAPAHEGKVAGKATKVADKNRDDGVVMIEGRDGALAPPKRWQHDGGTSVIARGEQGLEHVAAYRLGGQAIAAARRSHKTAMFAQLDGAGATASVTETQPQQTSFFATAPQAAAADPVQQTAPQVAANEAAGTPVSAATDADAGDKPKRRRRHRQRASEE